jgi:hypothetical protein
VQRSLNQHLGLRLAVDGISGPQTRAAVRSFQQRSGLSVDGIVGPRTEQALVAAGAGPPPQVSALPASGGTNAAVNTQLPSPGAGYYSYRPAREQFGLSQTIQALQAIGLAWQRAHPNGPRLGIGGISLRGGGPFPPHKSHQLGVDVDIRPLRKDGKDGKNDGATTFRSATYSLPLTQQLVDLIHKNGVLPVRFVLFADTRVRGTHEDKSHYRHLHVRFIAPGR